MYIKKIIHSMNPATIHKGRQTIKRGRRFIVADGPVRGREKGRGRERKGEKNAGRMACFTLTIPKPLCFFGLAHLFAYCYHGNCVAWVWKVGH